MIQVRLTADDWHVAEALADISTRIEAGDLLDPLYDGVTNAISVFGEHYKATLTLPKTDKDIVSVTCYGFEQKMPRDEAAAKYLEYIRNSEGSERERYETIYFQLLGGMTECHD